MPGDKVMLIDNSYYNFYRLYATISWYRYSSDRVKAAEGVPWLENETFMITFEKMWFETITKLCRKFNVKTKDIIFARDGHNVWRYKIYPEYKANRVMHAVDDPHSPGPVFGHITKHYHSRVPGASVIIVDKAEGDDIIAVATRYIKASFPNTRIIIITGDHDFFQLSRPGVDLYQLKGFKQFIIYNPQIELLIKILSGDQSDNIPASFKGCGKVTAKRLAHNPDELEAILDKKGRKQYNLNRRLIDFDFIPQNIVEKIEALLDVVYQ